MIRKGMIVFLLLIILVVSAIDTVTEPMTNSATPSQNKKCPTLLIRKGSTLVLYDEAQNELTRFSNLDEYIDFTKNQKARGVDCPILFLQHENNAQGQDVYRVRPSPFEMDGGSQPVDIIDAGRKSSVYNVNNYPSFDPMGLQIGKFNKLDEIHYSTAKDQLSDNPMDLNWGGVEHTTNAIASGKYDERQITRPIYFNPKTQFIPGIHNDQPTPPSYVASDLSPKWP